MVATNFSVAWQSKLLKKRLLAMIGIDDNPIYTDSEDFEFWTECRFSELAKGKTVDEIIDETWDDYYAALEV